MKVLFATTNPAKVGTYKEILEKKGRTNNNKRFRL